MVIFGTTNIFTNLLLEAGFLKAVDLFHYMHWSAFYALEPVEHETCKRNIGRVSMELRVQDSCSIRSKKWNEPSGLLFQAFIACAKYVWFAG